MCMKNSEMVETKEELQKRLHESRNAFAACYFAAGLCSIAGIFIFPLLMLAFVVLWPITIMMHNQKNFLALRLAMKQERGRKR